jgi:hypothetical protein
MATGPGNPEENGRIRGGGKSSGKFWPEWFTFRHFVEFAADILRLRRSVAALERKSDELEAAVADLQLQQAVQAKEIDMLVRLVEASITERIELKAENAAYRIIIGMQRSRNSDENSEK